MVEIKCRVLSLINKEKKINMWIIYKYNVVTTVSLNIINKE